MRQKDPGGGDMGHNVLREGVASFVDPAEGLFRI